MKRLLHALQFLTVFRVWDSRVTRGELSSSMAFFPVIGAIQGAVLAGADYLMTGYLPATVAAAVLLVIIILTNGGLHLDGFADTVDGLAGGDTREERLSIMKDSRIGSVGVAFVVLLLILKYSSIGALSGPLRPKALFLFPILGRWAMVPMACLSPYARKEGIGEPFAGNSYGNLFVSTLIAAAALYLLLGPYHLPVLLILGVTVYLFTLFFKRRLGGVTGDVFGFQSEVAEALFLILVLVFKKMSSTWP